MVKRKGPGQSCVLGPGLLEIIADNGFEINEGKTRLQGDYQRKVVTGLTVNEFPNVTRNYVRQVRAMLHAWRIYGLEKAQREYA